MLFPAPSKFVLDHFQRPKQPWMVPELARPSNSFLSCFPGSNDLPVPKRLGYFRNRNDLTYLVLLKKGTNRFGWTTPLIDIKGVNTPLLLTPAAGSPDPTGDLFSNFDVFDIDVAYFPFPCNGSYIGKIPDFGKIVLPEMFTVSDDTLLEATAIIADILQTPISRLPHDPRFQHTPWKVSSKGVTKEASENDTTDNENSANEVVPDDDLVCPAAFPVTPLLFNFLTDYIESQDCLLPEFHELLGGFANVLRMWTLSADYSSGGQHTVTMEGAHGYFVVFVEFLYFSKMKDFYTVRRDKTFFDTKELNAINKFLLPSISRMDPIPGTTNPGEGTPGGARTPSTRDKSLVSPEPVPPVFATSTPPALNPKKRERTESETQETEPTTVLPPRPPVADPAVDDRGPREGPPLMPYPSAPSPPQFDQTEFANRLARDSIRAIQEAHQNLDAVRLNQYISPTTFSALRPPPFWSETAWDAILFLTSPDPTLPVRYEEMSRDFSRWIGHSSITFQTQCLREFIKSRSGMSLSLGQGLIRDLKTGNFQWETETTPRGLTCFLLGSPLPQGSFVERQAQALRLESGNPGEKELKHLLTPSYMVPTDILSVYRTLKNMSVLLSFIFTDRAHITTALNSFISELNPAEFGWGLRFKRYPDLGVQILAVVDRHIQTFLQEVYYFVDSIPEERHVLPDPQVNFHDILRRIRSLEPVTHVLAPWDEILDLSAVRRSPAQHSAARSNTNRRQGQNQGTNNGNDNGSGEGARNPNQNPALRLEPNKRQACHAFIQAGNLPPQVTTPAGTATACVAWHFFGSCRRENRCHRAASHGTPNEAGTQALLAWKQRFQNSQTN